MLVKQVKKLTPMERLLYFIEERESIRLKKEADRPKPWSDDTILQQFRFCNVRRMDDKVSRWLLKNWYTPNVNHTNILLAATLARQLNNPTSLEAIGFPHKWNPKRADKILTARMAQGLTVFNAAYMITGTLGGTKIEQVVYKVADPIFKSKFVINPKSMEDNWERLLSFAGFSSFIAGQVVADLRWAVIGTWEDRNEWAPRGPGSQRGLAMLLGKDITTKFDQKDFCYELVIIQEHVEKYLPKIATRLELHDIQNCMCEFFKYTKTLTGIGRPKQRYNWVAECL